MVKVQPLMGRLTKEKFGFSMPVTAPLYEAPPHYYKDARDILVRYETDEEAALDILPEGLELPLPAIAIVLIAYYPFSTFGPYYEALQGLECLWGGEMRTYIAQIFVTTEAALAGGREIWGDPKKFAHIELRQENELFQGIVERPRGSRLCTLLVRPERPRQPPPETDPTVSSIALRVIPSPEEGAPPSIAELVEIADQPETHELWAGTGSVSFDNPSTLDPWHRLPVRRTKRGYYRRYDLTSPHGRIIKRY